jgi:hypothetical protein
MHGRVPPKDFRTLVKELAAERDISVAQVSFQANNPKIKGTNPDTMKSVMAQRRHPTAVLIEAVAKVLDVPPETFGEYRLALARRELDERQVGYPQAIAHLDEIEAMRAQVEQSGAPPVPGDTGRQLRAGKPTRKGRERPDSDQGTGASGSGQK